MIRHMLIRRPSLATLVAAAGAIGLSASVQAATLSSQDMMFLKQAASGGMTEVQAGQIAQSNAQSPAVKDFGQHMVQEHTANNQDLATLAQSKGAALPASPAAKDAAALTKLQGLQGAAFDTAYVKAQISGHEAMQRLMQKEAHSGKDADLKAFAQKTLPVVEQHLQMARQLPMGKG